MSEKWKDPQSGRKYLVLPCDEDLAERLFREAITYELTEIKQRVGFDIEDFGATRLNQIELRASALERLMKSYSGLISGNYLKDHDPYRIFNSMHEFHRNDFLAQLGGSEHDVVKSAFIDFLRRSSNTYNNSRFNSETGIMPDEGALDFLSDIMKVFIYRRRPKWMRHEKLLWDTKERLGLIPPSSAAY